MMVDDVRSNRNDTVLSIEDYITDDDCFLIDADDNEEKILEESNRSGTRIPTRKLFSFKIFRL